MEKAGITATFARTASGIQIIAINLIDDIKVSRLRIFECKWVYGSALIKRTRNRLIDRFVRTKNVSRSPSTDTMATTI